MSPLSLVETTSGAPPPLTSIRPLPPVTVRLRGCSNYGPLPSVLPFTTAVYCSRIICSLIGKCPQPPYIVLVYYRRCLQPPFTTVDVRQRRFALGSVAERDYKKVTQITNQTRTESERSVYYALFVCRSFNIWVWEGLRHPDMVGGKKTPERIEDEESRTEAAEKLAKRRIGLMEMASEISDLPGVDAALIFFSDRGKRLRSGIGSGSSENVEDYQSHSEEGQAACSSVHKGKEHEAENAQPWKGSDPVQMVQSYLDGMKVDQMDLTELMQLEDEVHSLLRETKIIKAKRMVETLSMLREKGEQLKAENQQYKESETAADGEGTSGRGGEVDPATKNPEVGDN